MAELAAQPGDAGDKARTIWRVMGEALGAALATLVNTFNFPLYLLSGGMLPRLDLFEPPCCASSNSAGSTYRATKAEMRIAQGHPGQRSRPLRRGVFALGGAVGGRLLPHGRGSITTGRPLPQKL